MGEDVLSNDRVAETLEELMADKKDWKGAATKLLSELETIVRRPEREAERALALAKSEARSSGSKVYDRLRTDAEKAKEEEAARRVAEATADLREARDRVHTIFSDKWPKAGNALSRRLKNVGPQLRGVGIHILWPTSHKDGKVLTVTNITIDLKKDKDTQTKSSSSSYRPPPPGDGADKDYDASDLGQSDVPGDQGEKPSPGSSGDDIASLDPDSWPAEPDQPDVSRGPLDSTNPNGSSARDKQHSSGLRDEDKGFEIRRPPKSWPGPLLGAFG
jgi:hypothetical protein